jgi:hypothetical protein
MNENNKIQGGYIITPRKFFQSNFWTEKRKFSHAEALQDLIQMASWEEKVYVPSIYNQIKLRRGEFATSYRQLAAKWKWGVASVKRFLDYLQKDFTIEFKSGTGGGLQKRKDLSTIFVINYDLYQDINNYDGIGMERERNTDGTLTERERNKTKEIKRNEKEMIKKESGDPPQIKYKSSFIEFWNEYPRKDGKFKASEIWTNKKLDSLKEEIIKGVKKAKGSDQWLEDDGKFIPHAATYLNQRRWEDQVEAIEKDNENETYRQKFYQENGYYPKK